MFDLVLSIVLLVVAIIFFISLPLIRKCILKNNCSAIYKLNINCVSKKLNCSLLNKINLTNHKDLNLVFDHLLFGNDNIYVIDDQYYEGLVTGKANEDSWIYISREKRLPEYIPNLLKTCSNNSNYLSRIIGVEKTNIVSIVLVNNSALLQCELKNDKCVVCTNKNLLKEIKQFETSKIKNQKIENVYLDLKEKNEKN